MCKFNRPSTQAKWLALCAFIFMTRWQLLNDDDRMRCLPPSSPSIQLKGVWLRVCDAAKNARLRFSAFSNRNDWSAIWRDERQRDKVSAQVRISISWWITTIRHSLIRSLLMSFNVVRLVNAKMFNSNESDVVRRSRNAPCPMHAWNTINLLKWLISRLNVPFQFNFLVYFVRRFDSRTCNLRR